MAPQCGWDGGDCSIPVFNKAPGVVFSQQNASSCPHLRVPVGERALVIHFNSEKEATSVPELHEVESFTSSAGWLMIRRGFWNHLDGLLLLVFRPNVTGSIPLSLRHKRDRSSKTVQWFNITVSVDTTTPQPYRTPYQHRWRRRPLCQRDRAWWRRCRTCTQDIPAPAPCEMGTYCEDSESEEIGPPNCDERRRLLRQRRMMQSNVQEVLQQGDVCQAHLGWGNIKDWAHNELRQVFTSKHHKDLVFTEIRSHDRGPRPVAAT
mmetsp:Transcript_3112/g.6637  ORF Transcript_3112/g.6637 Transcript_3112/m.6637 type:complete len:263 (-) Transcript_3112:38-826(-)